MSILWAALKITVIAGVFLWFSYNPGVLHMTWLGYDIETSVFFVVFLGILLFLIGTIISSGWQGLLWAGKRLLSLGGALKKDPHQVLAQAFFALELDNIKEAQMLAQEALSLNKDSALPAIVLLKASHLLKDKKNQSMALAHLKQFSEFAPMAFFDEVEYAIKNHQWDLAKKLIDEFASSYQNQAWFLKQSLKVSIGQKEWEHSISLLKTVYKKGGITKEAFHQIGAFLWYKLSKEEKISDAERLEHLEKSYTFSPIFLDALVDLAHLTVRQKDLRAAQTLLEKAWSLEPSWVIADAYCHLLAEKDHPLSRAAQARKLYDLMPDHPVSQLILVVYFIQAKLWGEAKRILALLPKGVPEVHVLKAALIKKEKNSMPEVLQHLKKAMKQISYPYKCSACRKSLDCWHVSCSHCGEFLSVKLKHPMTYANCLDALELPERLK